MKTQSVTESFARFLEMETASLERIQALHADVRRVRLALEAEIEECNRFLEEGEEM
jgi:hypothetical protein